MGSSSMMLGSSVNGMGGDAMSMGMGMGGVTDGHGRMMNMNSANANGALSNGGNGKSHEKNRVFVTKIPQSITKDNLIEYFNQFGALTDCYLPSPNPNSGTGKNGAPVLGP